MILIFAYRKSTTVLSKRINRNVLTCLYAGYRIEIHTRAQGWIVYTCAPQHRCCAVFCWKCWCVQWRVSCSLALLLCRPLHLPFLPQQSIIRIYDATQWAERGKMESWTCLAIVTGAQPAKPAKIYTHAQHPPTSKSSSLLCLMGEMWNVIYRNEVKEGAKGFYCVLLCGLEFTVM